ncbi:hypothetical protein OG592_42285 (plasmid) [Streptomyces avidinii]|uniref:hypothetical protein n=1 Tax=Streptomyces avidinii TaxID=1895 RepID=UPI002F9177A7|nr:hypothetical protein OG592_42285 [Streptomyces avidinii]
MNVRMKQGQHEGPVRTRSKYSPTVQVLGYLLGTVWFAFLALPDNERPGWLRTAYAVAALTFAFGAAATAIKHFRERCRGGIVR